MKIFKKNFNLLVNIELDVIWQLSILFEEDETESINVESSKY